MSQSAACRVALLLVDTQGSWQPTYFIVRSSEISSLQGKKKLEVLTGALITRVGINLISFLSAAHWLEHGSNLSNKEAGKYEG